jgi:hypothetical protein
MTRKKQERLSEEPISVTSLKTWKSLLLKATTRHLCKGVIQFSSGDTEAGFRACGGGRGILSRFRVNRSEDAIHPYGITTINFAM